MKFYAVIFGDWHGVDDMDVVDVFYNEEDAEKDIDRRYDNCECSPDEWFEIHEWDEKNIKKYWDGLPIS